MATNKIPNTDSTTPILFFKLNFSLKSKIPTKVETKTIPTLLIVNNVELSKPSVCNALIKKIIENQGYNVNKDG